MDKETLINETKLELLKQSRPAEEILDRFYIIAQSRAFEDHSELIAENMRWVRLQGQDMGKVFDKIP